MKKTVLTTLLSLLILSTSTAAIGGDSELEQATLSIRIEGFRSDQGLTYVNLFNDPDGFPGGKQDSFRWAQATSHEGICSIKFTGLPPGEYALNLIHDEDGDGRLNRNLLGIPVEGFGFSNDPELIGGPPEWEDAVFMVKPGEQEITIKVIYI